MVPERSARCLLRRTIYKRNLISIHGILLVYRWTHNVLVHCIPKPLRQRRAELIWEICTASEYDHNQTAPYLHSNLGPARKWASHPLVSSAPRAHHWQPDALLWRKINLFLLVRKFHSRDVGSPGISSLEETVNSYFKWNYRRGC